MNFIYVIYLFVVLPSGQIAKMPYAAYGSQPIDKIACTIDAAAMTRTVVQKYKFACMRYPELEI